MQHTIIRHKGSGQYTSRMELLYLLSPLPIWKFEDTVHTCNTLLKTTKVFYPACKTYINEFQLSSCPEIKVYLQGYQLLWLLECVREGTAQVHLWSGETVTLLFNCTFKNLPSSEGASRIFAFFLNWQIYSTSVSVRTIPNRSIQ